LAAARATHPLRRFDRRLGNRTTSLSILLTRMAIEIWAARSLSIGFEATIVFGGYSFFARERALFGLLSLRSCVRTQDGEPAWHPRWLSGHVLACTGRVPLVPHSWTMCGIGHLAPHVIPISADTSQWLTSRSRLLLAP